MEESIQPAHTHRTTLNTKQLRLISLLFKFRFMTATQLSAIIGSDKNSILRSLKLLEELGYIAKHYTNLYRIDRKPAEFYLLPNALQLLRKREIASVQSLRAHYENPTASPEFVARCLTIVDVYSALMLLMKHRIHSLQALARSHVYVPQ